MAGDIQAAVKEQRRAAVERYAGFRRELNERQQQLLDALVFLLRFTALAAPFYLVLGSGWAAEGVRAATADVAATMLDASGIAATSTRSFIRTDSLVVDVTRDSTGWKSVMVFAALVLATSRSATAKVKAVFVGGILLLGVNILRITTTVYAVHIAGIPYELLHTVLWRWGLTAVVLSLWAIWMGVSGSSSRFPWLQGR